MTRAMKEFFKVIIALVFVILRFILMSGIPAMLFGHDPSMMIATGFL